MDQLKFFLTSKTVWGLILMLAARFFPHAASVVVPDDFIALVNQAFELIGGAMILVGRFRASQPLGLIPNRFRRGAPAE